MDSSIYSLFAIPNDNSFKAFINEGSTEITRLPLQIKPIKLSEYFNSPLKQILKPFDIFWKNTKNFPQIEELHNNFDDSFDILLEKKIPYHVLLNKSDKLNNSEKISTLEECKKTLEQKDSEFKIKGSCSLFSVPKKAGLEELQFKLMEWLFR